MLKVRIQLPVLSTYDRRERIAVMPAGIDPFRRLELMFRVSKPFKALMTLGIVPVSCQ